MSLNRLGEYQPFVDQTTCVECGLCKAVCPMEYESPSDGHDLFGNLTRFYVAHTANESLRGSCASGGVVTQLLVDLLAQRKIDGAICVGSRFDNDKLFEPRICNSSEEVLSCRGSKYYPIEFSGVLREISGDSKTYAMVCLPCVATAVRRLQQIDRNFERIKYVLSLTCGHNKTTHYVKSIADRNGLHFPLRDLSFRVKGSYPFSNFRLRMVDAVGRSSSESFLNSPINTLWCGMYFSQHGCLSCRDIFGVHGHASFMDAWQYPYIRSKRGYNYIAARDDFGEDFIEGNSNIVWQPIRKSDIVESQKDVYDRKSTGAIPQQMRQNKELSEAYVLASRDLGAIVCETARTRRAIVKIEIMKSLRPRYAATQLKEWFKQLVNHYENLIGR